MIWKQYDFWSCCPLEALSGNCGLLLIRLLLLRQGKMALGSWHLVPSLKTLVVVVGCHAALLQPVHSCPFCFPIKRHQGTLKYLGTFASTLYR